MHAIYTTQQLLETTPRTCKNPPPRRRKTAVTRITALALAWMLALLCPLKAGAQSYTATFVGPDLDFPVPSLAKVNDHGTPYRYVVTAVNTLGLESPASNAVSAQRSESLCMSGTQLRPWRSRGLSPCAISNEHRVFHRAAPLRL